MKYHDAAASSATGRVRATTAHSGPTQPARQNSGESAAVSSTRPTVARLAMPAACPMYMTTK